MNATQKTLLALTAAVLATLVGCSATGPPPGTPVGPELVDGGVIFRYYDSRAAKVYVVGDFNNWSLRADPLTDTNGDGHWTLLYMLSPGLYEYKFVVDGKWIPDPQNPNTVPDGFDGVNSVIRIPKTVEK